MKRNSKEVTTNVEEKARQVTKLTRGKVAKPKETTKTLVAEVTPPKRIRKAPTKALKELMKEGGFKEASSKPKSLGNTCSNGATKNVKDIVFWGDGDLFKLLSKASSEDEGWMKSTKAMEIAGVGCVVQVTTQQRNPDGSYSVAEAVTFAPNTTIEEVGEDGIVVSRKLVNLYI